MDQFDHFEFRPWMGYLGGLALFAAGWGIESDVGILVRALGLSLFFGTSARSHHKARRQSGAGASVGELRSVVFAGFAGLIALAFLLACLAKLWISLRG